MCLLPPGASLRSSEAAADAAIKRLQEIPDVTSIVCKVGRAELDEHVMGVNVSEMILSLDPEQRTSTERSFWKTFAMPWKACPAS